MNQFEKFCRWYWAAEEPPFALDISRLDIPESYLDQMKPDFQAAHNHVKELERGAIANPDEDRMVGHYWLRNFSMIPDEKIRREVEQDDQEMRNLAEMLFESGRFSELLLIGIGGSALGPQLVSAALGHSGEGLTPHFMDNTDPDGFELELGGLEGKLDRTLAVVISKSGGTPETRNGMLYAMDAFERAGLSFPSHAIAITGRGSKLDKQAESEKWLARIPMYDWVGGRTSVMSAVGLFPAMMQGIDIDGLLAGAKEMDALTRQSDTRENPAALLALAWHYATNGKGEKDMVIIPYKDRLALFSKYLQQLIMESLGKEKDLDGNVVNQGIAVYGNKGSTDQHSYIQQLREGVNNFFVTFIEVLRDGGRHVEVAEKVTPGDFLEGFYLGTRQALYEKDRGSVTITIDDVTARTLGGLIALYERAVTIYAYLININAYHQPGVEAGKKAAATILEAQKSLIAAMSQEPGKALSAADWGMEARCDAETAFKLLHHLSRNGRHVKMEGLKPDTSVFTWEEHPTE